MKLNTSTDYAVLIMLYLAENKRVISSAELAENISVSKRYLIQIADRLRDGGLIHVNMGLNGGYSLSRKADQISIYDIVSVMEGPIEILKYTNNSVKHYDILFDAYSKLERHVNNYLKAMTLERLIAMSCTEWQAVTLDMIDQYSLTLRVSED